MAERFELQRLLWDLRHDATVVEQARRDMGSVTDEYCLAADEADALQREDFAALLAMGASPMLVYFAALDLGIERDHYYAQIRGVQVGGGS